MTEPDYTHALHFDACQRAAKDRKIVIQHVLAKRGQIVYCAIIKVAYTVPSGPDCWTLQTLWPEITRLTIPCKNVIACNPAFCSCVAERQSVVGGSAAGLDALPFPVLEK